MVNQLTGVNLLQSPKRLPPPLFQTGSKSQF